MKSIGKTYGDQSFAESILREADAMLPKVQENDTLVIHMDDRSTDFLKVIYGGKGYPVIKGKISSEELMAEIKRYPRIFMLGHGSPSGLFGPGYMIGDEFGEVLREKTGIYIWCHAVEYAHKNKLSGLVSGMFISEVAEARYMGIEATQKEVTASNYAFSKAVRRYLETGSSPHEAISCYNNAVCKVTRYNNERLYVMEKGVILDALGQPQPDTISAKKGSPRYYSTDQGREELKGAFGDIEKMKSAYGDIDEPPEEFKRHYGWKDFPNPEDEGWEDFPGVNEGRWRNLAAAGLVGASLLKYPQLPKQAYNAAQGMVNKAMAPRPMYHMPDPNKALPSEEKLTDWEYIQKKGAQRDEVSKLAAPFTKHYLPPVTGPGTNTVAQEADQMLARPPYSGFDAEYLNSGQPIPRRTATVYGTLHQPWALRYARAMRDKYGINVWVDGSVTLGWRIKVHADDADRASRMFKSVVGERLPPPKAAHGMPPPPPSLPPPPKAAEMQVSWT